MPRATLLPIHGPDVRLRALALVGSGRSLSSVSIELGVSRSSIRDWMDQPEPRRLRATCCRCTRPATSPQGWAYAHLLGLYLGDGCLSLGAKGVYTLRISCTTVYPRLVAECEESLQMVRPGGTWRSRKQGCVDVGASSKHWTHLFPQHGPGRKHERPIVLEAWQREIVEEHPGRFLRGLFHSDGCRITNWTTRSVAGAVKRYEYPRYFFTNVSADIRGLCCWALAMLDVAHTHPTERDISVARKWGVAVLDDHVGPKS